MATSTQGQGVWSNMGGRATLGGVLLLSVGAAYASNFLVGLPTVRSCVKDGDPSSKDYCGELSPDGCSCVAQCATNCCHDYREVCVAATPEPPADVRAEVIFTEPPCIECTTQEMRDLTRESRALARIIALIEGAKETIDVALFTFTRTDIGDALLAAQARGVRVRLAMDAGQQKSRTLSSKLQQQGLDVRFVKGRTKADGARYDGLLHSKIMLVDVKVAGGVATSGKVLTGSCNWSTTGVSINEEHIIIVEAPDFGERMAGFVCHFEAAWDRNYRESAPCSSSDTYFTPNDDVVDMLRGEVRGAQTSVHVLMHHFTYKSLVEELTAAAARGVDVRVVVNAEDKADYEGGVWDGLRAAGGKMRYRKTNEDLSQVMHQKLAIVDGRVLLVGSGNWSGGGFTSNLENYLRFRERVVTAPFVVHYKRLWDIAVASVP